MVDKKFSDFSIKPLLDTGDIIPTETVGVDNNRTTYGEFKAQLQNEILATYGRVAIGRVVNVLCNHNNGVPIGYDGDLIYADGSQHLRTESNAVAKFIDYCKTKTNLKALYQIPDSGNYFIVPDLRNKHLVGVGDKNLPFSFQESKIMSLGANATTTVVNSGVHTHPINDINGNFNIRVKSGDDQRIVMEAYGGFHDEGASGSYFGVNGSPNQSPGQKISFSSHRAGVTATNNSGDHTHSATTSITYNNTNIFDPDNLVRVPSMAVFTFIDISINEKFINPNLNIGMIDNLQSTLDGKVNLTQYNIDLPLKANLTYVDSQDNLKANKLQFRTSNYQIKRSGLTTAIGNSPTVGTNINTILQNVASVVSGQVNYLGGTNATTGYPALTNSTTVGHYVLPQISGVVGYSVTIAMRITGTWATAGDVKYLFARLLTSSNILITSISLIRIIPNTPDNLMVGVLEPIRVNNNTSILVQPAGGFRIEIFNNNPVASNFTANSIELALTFN